MPQASPQLVDAVVRLLRNQGCILGLPGDTRVRRGLQDPSFIAVTIPLDNGDQLQAAPGELNLWNPVLESRTPVAGAAADDWRLMTHRPVTSEGPQGGILVESIGIVDPPRAVEHVSRIDVARVRDVERQLVMRSFPPHQAHPAPRPVARPSLPPEPPTRPSRDILLPTWTVPKVTAWDLLFESESPPRVEGVVVSAEDPLDAWDRAYEDVYQDFGFIRAEPSDENILAMVAAVKTLSDARMGMGSIARCCLSLGRMFQRVRSNKGHKELHSYIQRLAALALALEHLWGGNKPEALFCISAARRGNKGLSL